MESTEELQQQEITALRSIYGDDFEECPPPKVWKDAPRLPEFMIKVSHPEDTYASRCFLSLVVTFPKSYPAKACPTFTIKNTKGLLGSISTLTRTVQQEAKKNQGSEMVFQIVTFIQDWLASNIKLPKEGSLKYQMELRNMEEEQARREKEEAEAEKETLKATQMAEQLSIQMREDTLRQKLELEQLQQSRKRGMSDATQVPMSPVAGDTPTETFPNDIEWDGVVFNTVKLFHPRKEYMGTVFLAEPVCDDIHASLPLELVMTVFNSDYYKTSQGKKKLKQIESEMLKLINVRHPNILSIFAVKLLTPHSDYPRLVILTEQRPSLCLQDVLEDCDTLREERASEYLRQILTGLHALHTHDIVHRGLSPRTVFLANSSTRGQPKAVKLGKAGYWIRLIDLYKSNAFSCDISSICNDFNIPEAWLPKEVVDSPLIYTKSRDIHSVGVVLLQMLLGRDVMEKFTTPKAAVQSPSLPQRVVHHVSNMLSQTRKNGVSCSTLLVDLSDATSYRLNPAAIQIPTAPRTPTGRQPQHVGSPDDYFVPRMRPRPTSRWRDEFEELELLGRGAYGSVVKARHKMDGGIYAVKKIKLRDSKKSGDGRLLREVSALRQLSHRYIVRYYTTWTETSDPRSAAGSDSESDAETVDGITSMPHSHSTKSRSRTENSENLLSLDLNDFGSNSSKSSFPSIHFGGTGDSSEGSSEGDEDEDDGLKNLFDPLPTSKPLYTGRFGSLPRTPTLSTSRTTLYIQMEFVERQTLKERIADGLTEEEAWRLFQQIVEALVHISSHGILHRDIKLTNIFIDAKGDCKVGDFGLATSSLAAVDPTDKSPHIGLLEDLTLDVGTKLYMAPEATAHPSKRVPQDQNKADMYSLGIVFFEMNYFFSTGAERIAVLEDVRKPGIFFPSSWEARRDRQKQIIVSLLQHDPVNRPSALQLSQSPLLPHLLQDDNFQRVLKMIAMRDSSHHEAVLSTLFNRTTKQSRGFLFYNGIESPEHIPLYDMVQEKLKAIFRLHGAIDQEPPFLTPVLNPEEEVDRAVLLDRRGQAVSLPTNGLVPFARLAARNNNQRIKRFHFFNTYRPSPAGHPNLRKTALFDIITPDLENGPGAAIAEMIAIVIECFSAFPKLRDAHEIHVSHSKIVQLALARVPEDLRPATIEILTEPKLTSTQRRAMLLKKGLLKSTVDELEVLDSKEDWVDTILLRVERVSRQFANLIRPAIKEISETFEHLDLLGVPARQSVILHPLMLGSNSYYSEGVCFEIIRPGRRSDALASGGRYDGLINQFYTPDQVVEPIRAMVLQISVDRIAAFVVAFQKASAHTFLREPKSFGFWSPRRCDVYIVSYTPGYLNDRLEVAALLWKNGISADVMYEAPTSRVGQEDHMDVCDEEGILFTVYPRPRTARRDQSAFKVKSVLKGTEYEVARQDLVVWLQEKIAEQKRVDANTSGVERPIMEHGTPIIVASNKDHIGAKDVQLILPGDLKKGKAGPKQIFADRAFEMSMQVKHAVQSGLPTLAIDVPDAVFEAMSKNTGWIIDEDPEVWRAILASFPTQQTAYAYQIKEAIGKRKEEGCRFVLLFAARGERVCLLDLI